MKKYIRVCDCCGNTFETDMTVKCCKFCSDRMKSDFLFYKNFMEKNGWKFPRLVSLRTGCYKVVDNYKMEYPINKEDAFNY